MKRNTLRWYFLLLVRDLPNIRGEKKSTASRQMVDQNFEWVTDLWKVQFNMLY